MLVGEQRDCLCERVAFRFRLTTSIMGLLWRPVYVYDQMPNVGKRNVLRSIQCRPTTNNGASSTKQNVAEVPWSELVHYKYLHHQEHIICATERTTAIYNSQCDLPLAA